MGETPNFDVEFYQASDQSKPAADFLSGVRGTRAETILKEQLYEFQEKGLHGDIKSIKGGISGLREFRSHAGPGYRIYFVEKPGGMVILGMSDKSGQDRELAKVFDRAETYQNGIADARRLERSAAELENAAKDVGKKTGRHNIIIAIGAGAAIEAFTHNHAEAAQATADMMPFARVAAAPNSVEGSVRALGDSGLVLGAIPVVGPVVGPVAEFVTGVGEEVVRFGNDIANTVGFGTPKIQKGLVMSTADMVGYAGSYAASAAKRVISGVPTQVSEPVLFKAPATEGSGAELADVPDPGRLQGRRSQAPLNSRIDALLPLSGDTPPPVAQTHVATTRQPLHITIRPLSRPPDLGAGG